MESYWLVLDNDTDWFMIVKGTEDNAWSLAYNREGATSDSDMEVFGAFPTFAHAEDYIKAIYGI